MKSKHLVYSFFKRVCDIVGSVIALILLSPVFLVIAVLIKKYDHGPVFFRQTRIGRYGKKFQILKFRSMATNAEERLNQNKKLHNKYVKNNFKLAPEEDPRITPIGRWMRRTSVDEVPQFINILKGDMSIIGPRPVIEEELSEYGDRKDKLLSVKPGAMGIWQASGRSNIGYPERCEIELGYIDKASLGFDFLIFCKTLISIIKVDGAY